MAAPKNPALAHRARPPDVGRAAGGADDRIDHAREFDRGAVTHQPARADGIRARDCSKPAFDALTCHGCVPQFVSVMDGSLGKAANRV